MIIVDFSQNSHACVHVLANEHASTDGSSQITLDHLRGLLLNHLIGSLFRHKQKYGGPVVLACDSHAWRYDVFPQYKWSRTVNRGKDGIDWDAVHQMLNTIEQELREYFPYLLIRVRGAEGDDVIGTLVSQGDKLNSGGSLDNLFGVVSKPLIISSDHDFSQLHDVADQWCPRTKVFLKTGNAALALKRQILEGDVGDGVPNLLSDDDTFVVVGKRQKPLSSKLKMQWLHESPNQFCVSDELKHNWERNSLMIDLKRAPVDVKSAILEEYQNQLNSKRSKTQLLEYFMSRNLGNLASRIQDIF